MTSKESGQLNPDTAISIRKGGPDDADATWRLFQAHLNWINVWYDLGRVVQRRNTGDYSFQLHVLSLYPSAIAEVDGRVIGYTVSELREIDVLEIRNMYVDDPYRGQGIGLQLLQEVERQAAAKEIESIVAFSSAKYFEDKVLPTHLFERAGFDIQQISSKGEIYLKRIGDSEETDQPRRLTILPSTTES